MLSPYPCELAARAGITKRAEALVCCVEAVWAVKIAER